MRQNKEEAQRIAELARVDRFKDFSDAEIAEVVKAANYHTVPDGWAIIAEHTPGDKAYLILSGTVSVRRGGEEIAQAGPGDIVGEMALVDHKLRSATVVALTPLEVLNFSSSTVDELQGKIPHFREALSSSAAERHK
ncbi:MAG: cyclic nucleotide-binding domain-containing protein [Marmoricola sp.]